MTATPRLRGFREGEGMVREARMLVTQQKILRRFWYPIVPVDRLTDAPLPFTLLGTNIVLFRDAEGRASALIDRCCHRTATLSKGWLDARKNRCPHTVE